MATPHWGRVLIKLSGEAFAGEAGFGIDGEVVSAPVVQSRIDGGRVQISLGMQSDYDQTLANAAHLATALRPGARISTRFTLVEPAR